MKAMLVDENKNLVWSDVADPQIKADEVLVKILNGWALRLQAKL